MNAERLQHYRLVPYLAKKNVIKNMLWFCIMFISVEANAAYFANKSEEDGIQSKCLKNSTAKSDLRLKIDDIVNRLKNEKNDIINENISSLIEPYFSDLSEGITEANTIVKNSCLSKFSIINGNLDDKVQLYRSYTVLERGFSSKLTMIIDIKFDINRSTSKSSEIKSYLNFVTL